MTIRVAVVDDHPIVLAGIRSLIGTAPDLDLVGEATDGKSALEMIKLMAPDVAVMDLSLPGMTGTELARVLSTQAPTVKLLILTVLEDRAYLQPLLDAGIRGYLLKRSAAEELIRAIRAVFSGGLFIDPNIANKFINERPHHLSIEATELSLRETEVLQYIVQGFSNKEIAARIGLSTKSVETYRARASEKLGVHTRAEIVRYGVLKGWLQNS